MEGVLSEGFIQGILSGGGFVHTPINIHGDKFKVVQFSATHVSDYFLKKQTYTILLLVHNLYLIYVKLTYKLGHCDEHVISKLVIVFELAILAKPWLQCHWLS